MFLFRLVELLVQAFGSILSGADQVESKRLLTPSHVSTPHQLQLFKVSSCPPPTPTLHIPPFKVLVMFWLRAPVGLTFPATLDLFYITRLPVRES